MKYLFSYALFLFLFLIDRVTKWAIVSLGVDSYEVTSWLSFDVQLNRGISWSLFHSDNMGTFLFITLCVIAVTLCVVAYAVYQWRLDKSIYGQTMVIAGSVSNILDRMVYGGVVDFIHVHIKGWSFAVFNIADVAIVVGVCIMMLQEVYDNNEKS